MANSVAALPGQPKSGDFDDPSRCYRGAMAVLTAIDPSEAQEIAKAHGLGDLRSLEGIAAGSVNSNFSVVLGGVRFFLRVYEERDLAGARGEAAMLERLARAGVPTPAPLRRLDGEHVSVLRGKPAALLPWRQGSMRCQAAVTPNDTRLVGRELARIHVAGATEACELGRFRYEDLRGRLRAIEKRADGRFVEVVPRVSDALNRAHAARDTGLPHGLIHGDLFRDNVLWNEDGAVSALLDFESASEGTYAYDLMVCVLSWCVGRDLDARLAASMRAGYESVRPLSDRERRALPAEGAFAALRFTITRITDYALRSDVAGPRVVKDWRRFWMRHERLLALGPEGLARVLDS